MAANTSKFWAKGEDFTYRATYCGAVLTVWRREPGCWTFEVAGIPSDSNYSRVHEAQAACCRWIEKHLTQGGCIPVVRVPMRLGERNVRFLANTSDETAQLWQGSAARACMLRVVEAKRPEPVAQAEVAQAEAAKAETKLVEIPVAEQPVVPALATRIPATRAVPRARVVLLWDELTEAQREGTLGRGIGRHIVGHPANAFRTEVEARWHSYHVPADNPGSFDGVGVEHNGAARERRAREKRAAAKLAAQGDQPEPTPPGVALPVPEAPAEPDVAGEALPADPAQRRPLALGEEAGVVLVVSRHRQGGLGVYAGGRSLVAHHVGMSNGPVLPSAALLAGKLAVRRALKAQPEKVVLWLNDTTHWRAQQGQQGRGRGWRD